MILDDIYGNMLQTAVSNTIDIVNMHPCFRIMQNVCDSASNQSNECDKKTVQTTCIHGQPRHKYFLVLWFAHSHVLLFANNAIMHHEAGYTDIQSQFILDW